MNGSKTNPVNIFQQSTSSKPKPRFQVKENASEQLRGIGSGIGSSIKRDLFGGLGGSAMKSVFSPGLMDPSESRPFPESPFRREGSFGPKKVERPREHFVFTAQEAQMQKKIEEIRHELKLMISQLKDVDKQIQKEVDAPMPESGVYHLNYLERLKTILTFLRKELENSGTWKQLMQSRKKQKGYWLQYKKKGTSFGQSFDRTVATQTG